MKTPRGDFVTAYSPEEVRQRFVVLIVAACLMGVALTIRELVGERWSTFRREYAVGLSPNIYFVRKLVVLGTAAFLQGVLVTVIATVGLPPPDGRAGTLRVALVIGALSFTMAVVGLCVSALVTSNEQTMPALGRDDHDPARAVEVAVRSSRTAGAGAGLLAGPLSLGLCRPWPRRWA